jgi:hypothetical protein
VQVVADGPVLHLAVALFQVLSQVAAVTFSEVLQDQHRFAFAVVQAIDVRVDFLALWKKMFQEISGAAVRHGCKLRDSRRRGPQRQEHVELREDESRGRAAPSLTLSLTISPRPHRR